ncbi:MAG: hypothetical protein M0Z84_14185 [Gammaproteobacteria bacterium]|nr:hypothetical protein [Gammaproteobacteria bacterium]
MTRLFGSRGRYGIGLAGVGVLCTILAGCGGGGGAGGAPSSQAGTGSSSIIAGVSAATLQWNAPNQDMSGACINVASYQIHYGTSSTNLTQTATVPAGTVSCTNSGTTNACGPIQSCTYPIKNLSSGTWYFAVQVTDVSGQQSGYSSIAPDSIP